MTKTAPCSPLTLKDGHIRALAIALSRACLPAWWLMSRWRCFDPDEWQHLHTASQIARGHVPYRDFFEHHTPLFHYLLAPGGGDGDGRFCGAIR